jgi:hypothetical protein
MITKTLGRNIVEGTVRNLSGASIRKLSKEHGDDWFIQPKGSPRKRYMLETAGATRKTGKDK